MERDGRSGHEIHRIRGWSPPLPLSSSYASPPLFIVSVDGLHLSLSLSSPYPWMVSTPFLPRVTCAAHTAVTARAHRSNSPSPPPQPPPIQACTVQCAQLTKTNGQKSTRAHIHRMAAPLHLGPPPIAPHQAPCVSRAAERTGEEKKGASVILDSTKVHSVTPARRRTG
jgi:hypothetical protein